MLILAVDSATPVAGVALLDENKLIREEFINYKKTHSETLMPTIDRVLKDCDCSIKDLTAIAVTIGPGSFTGLRIGLAAVKGISLAAGIPVIGVVTLDALAAGIIYSETLVCSILDARKDELYCGFYDVSGISPVNLDKISALSPEKFFERTQEVALKHNKNKVILLGNGYYRYQQYFDNVFQDRLQPVPAHLMLPRAAAVGSIAVTKAKLGQFDDAFNLNPLYIRLSEAEYKLGKGAV